MTFICGVSVKVLVTYSFFVDCMPPFELVDTGCYYASEEQRQSWTGARLACEGLGGHLAVITSSQEQSALVGYLNRVYPGENNVIFGILNYQTITKTSNK